MNSILITSPRLDPPKIPTPFKKKTTHLFWSPKIYPKKTHLCYILPKKHPILSSPTNKQNPLKTEPSHLTTGTLEGASLRLKRLARPRWARRRVLPPFWVRFGVFRTVEGGFHVKFTWFVWFVCLEMFCLEMRILLAGILKKLPARQVAVNFHQLYQNQPQLLKKMVRYVLQVLFLLGTKKNLTITFQNVWSNIPHPGNSHNPWKRKIIGSHQPRKGICYQPFRSENRPKSQQETMEFQPWRKFSGAKIFVSGRVVPWMLPILWNVGILTTCLGNRDSFRKAALPTQKWTKAVDTVRRSCSYNTILCLSETGMSAEQKVLRYLWIGPGFHDLIHQQWVVAHPSSRAGSSQTAVKNSRKEPQIQKYVLYTTLPHSERSELQLFLAHQK